MVTIECPTGEVTLEKMKEVCHSFSCQVDYKKGTRKAYFEITGKAQDIFWLGVNLNHRLWGSDPVLEIKKRNPRLYK